jgi:hypothetical protein
LPLGSSALGYDETVTGFDQYETALSSARADLGGGRALASLMAPDVAPAVLEAFLIQFSAIGVQMTEPVEGWIRRAGERCSALGLPALGRALVMHAAHEAGHHELMIRDTRTLVGRWNARRPARLDADELLAKEAPAGVRRYVELHEQVIASDRPYRQIAIEYEIERLSVQHGAPLLGHCAQKLGREILEGLSFLEEHVAVDAGHTKFNAQELSRLLGDDPSSLAPLVETGRGALAAYGRFLDDCFERGLAIAA